jgi:glycosyltransferase involved in cell wall biosynthesis
MRILICSDFFYPVLHGGLEKRVYEVSKRLAKKHEMHVITRGLKGLPSYETHDGIHIYRISVPSGGLKRESISDGFAFISGALSKGLRLGSFDIYSAEEFVPLVPLGIAAKIRGGPLIVTLHEVYRENLRREFRFKGGFLATLEKRMLKLPYKKIITVSTSTRKNLIKSGASESVIEVIPNGVDVNKFDMIEATKPTKRRVIYVGRLVLNKHIDNLLNVFSKLDSDTELYIVGWGPERRNLEALAKKLKIDHKVTFTGFIDERKKIELLKSSSILVSPSTAEGFGVALIEAMAARTSVLAADIPAFRELIKDGENGLLFKPQNIDDLKSKLELLLESENLQKKFSKNGHALVMEKFTWDKVAEKVENTFRSCVKKIT